MGSRDLPTWEQLQKEHSLACAEGYDADCERCVATLLMFGRIFPAWLHVFHRETTPDAAGLSRVVAAVRQAGVESVLFCHAAELITGFQGDTGVDMSMWDPSVTETDGARDVFAQIGVLLSATASGAGLAGVTEAARLASMLTASWGRTLAHTTLGMMAARSVGLMPPFVESAYLHLFGKTPVWAVRAPAAALLVAQWVGFSAGMDDDGGRKAMVRLGELSLVGDAFTILGAICARMIVAGQPFTMTVLDRAGNLQAVLNPELADHTAGDMAERGIAAAAKYVGIFAQDSSKALGWLHEQVDGDPEFGVYVLRSLVDWFAGMLKFSPVPQEAV